MTENQLIGTEIEKETEKELSLDFNKEVNSKYSERLSSVLNEITSGYNFSTMRNEVENELITKSNSNNRKFNNLDSGFNMSSNQFTLLNYNYYQNLNYNKNSKNNFEVEPRIIQTVEEMQNKNKINKKIIKLDDIYSRLGKLRYARKEFNLNHLNKVEVKRLLSEKNQNILNEINYLFELLEKIKTDSSLNSNIKDSLLKSEQDF
jgi:hypothetical protein